MMWLIILITCSVLNMANFEDRMEKVTFGRGKYRFPGPHHTEVLKWQSKKSVFEFKVDVSKVAKNVSSFWKSTGLCPPDPHQEICTWLRSSSVVQSLALIGAIPHAGIQQVRVHWLLDSIKISRNDHNGHKIMYNFTCLDEFIENLFTNDLYPGFEVMGNPSNYFSDFEDPIQVVQWKDFIQELASHYIDLYGLGYVSRWNFESWNEPKPKAFDGLNMTLKGFLNYYDATAEGLRGASLLLRLGGPGGACPDDFDSRSYCWALLDHAANGNNYFTGKKDVKLDFISIHKKGHSPSNVAVMIEKEEVFMSLLKLHLPSLATKPIYNDEADPVVTWSTDREWQADVTYAAMATKAISAHVQSSSIGLRLLSNDNGFLSYQPYPYMQRTLLARFQVNITSPPHVQFIRKPIYAVMGMLSLLGDLLLLDASRNDQFLCGDHMCDILLKNLSILATLHKPTIANIHDSWQLGVIVYFSEDTVLDSRGVETSIFLQNLPTDQELAYAVYLLDNVYSNPYAFWKFSGSPPTPNWNTFQEMRNYEEPVRMIGPAVWPAVGHGQINLSMQHPSVALIHFCAKTTKPPNQVTNVVFYNITFGQVLVLWSDSCVGSKCIKTYEVEFSRVNREELFHRINPKDSFFTSFVYSGIISKTTSQNEGAASELVRGFYRVKAVDYWDRSGPYSLVATYPS